MFVDDVGRARLVGDRGYLIFLEYIGYIRFLINRDVAASMMYILVLCISTYMPRNATSLEGCREIETNLRAMYSMVEASKAGSLPTRRMSPT